MPALAAAYGTGEPGWGLRAAADETVMMLPAFRSFIPGRKLLMVRNVAVRLPSTAARQSSSLICSTGPGLAGLPPALATSRPTGPISCSISWRIASMSANLMTSAATCIARPPASSMRAVTAAVADYLRALVREERGDCRTDATRTPGHQRHLVLQAAHDSSVTGVLLGRGPAPVRRRGCGLRQVLTSRRRKLAAPMVSATAVKASERISARR